MKFLPDKRSTVIKVFPQVFIVLYPIFLFFLLELLNPGEISSVVNICGIELPNLFVRSPYNAVMSHLPAVLFAVGAIYILSLILYALSGSVFISYGIVSVFLYALYIANYYRKLISGMVLSPAELSLAGDMGGIVSLENIPLDRRVVFTAVMLLAALVVLFFLRNMVKIALKKRMLLFSGALAAGLLFYGTIPAQRALFNQLQVNYVSFKMSNNAMYNQCGVMLGFYVSMQSNNIDTIFAEESMPTLVAAGLPSERVQEAFAAEQDAVTPLDRIGAADFKEKYAAEYMTDLIDRLKENLGQTEKTASPVEKPNVIVIMSEAFSDPMTWDNILFSDDPAPTLHALQETETNGQIITPEVFGRTSNPEYELLTGSPMYFADTGDIPFEQQEKYIPATDKRALPQIFRNNGYRTVGIHTNTGTYYNREDIYPKLGFDDFISLEDMPDAYLDGLWTSDTYFTDKIIEQLEQSEEPAFIYGISMQNHFQYFPGKFESADVISASDQLDLYHKGIADSYLQGVYDADQQLGRLIDYLKQSDKPTIVYFFGDHLPLLGEASAVFTSLGFISTGDLSQWNLDESSKMYATPYVLWANYDLPTHDWQDMSTYFIGPLLLDIAGLDQNMYFDFLKNAYRSFHAMKPQLYLNESGQYSALPLLQDKAVLDALYYLNYDYIFGKQYSKDAQTMMSN